MTLDFSNIDHTESDHENDDTSLSLEKLLFDAEEVSELQRARSSVEHEVERSDDVFEHFTLEDYDNAFTSKSRQDEDQIENIVDSSSVHLRSDDSTSNEQVEKQYSLSTSLTFVTDSETEYDSWNFARWFLHWSMTSI